MKSKSISIIILFTLLCGCGIMIYSYISLKHGVMHERLWNSYISIVKYNDGQYGIKEKGTGNTYGHYDEVLPYYNSNESESSSLVVIKDGLRGYVSSTNGELLFEPQFLYAWVDDSESNLAACVNQEYKLGFVNVRTKEIAIPFQYDFDENSLVPYGKPVWDFVFSNGLCIIPGENGLIGLIDSTGTQILPTIYSDIINWKDANTPEIILKRPVFYGGIGIYPKSFSGHMYVNYIEENTPAEKCDKLAESDIILKIKTDGDYVDVTHLDNNEVIALIMGDIGTSISLLVQHENGSIEEISLVREETGQVKKYIYGVCDRNFNVILPFEYDSLEKDWVAVYDMEPNIHLFGYIVSRSGKYGLLDTSFKERLPLKYDIIETSNYNNSYIVASNGKYGVLNESLETLLPLIYEQIDEIELDNEEGSFGYVAVKNYSPSLFSSTGELLNDFYVKTYYEFDSESDEYIEKPGLEAMIEPNQAMTSPYIQYNFNGYYGVIDGNKRVVVPAKYDKIEYLGNGKFACILNDITFLLHDNNQ